MIIIILLAVALAIGLPIQTQCPQNAPHCIGVGSLWIVSFETPTVELTATRSGTLLTREEALTMFQPKASPTSSPNPTPVPTPAVYALTLSTTTVRANQPFTVNWSAPVGHSTKDWISLYQVGASNQNFIRDKWVYVPAGVSGTVTLTAPAAGSYEVRYLLNDGFTSAGSKALTVAP